MVWSAYSPVWNAIVPNGYIMVFPTTETGFSPSHTNFAKDMAYLVGAMKLEGLNTASTFFGSVANTSAVLGHSMGGGSAFLAIQYDTSITALATFAAADTTPSSISAATGILIPSIVIAGASDCIATPTIHQLPMYNSLSSLCKTFISINGGSHCQFANTNINCNFGEATCSPQPTITPIAQQTTSFNLLLPWLNYYLKNNYSEGTQFQNLIATSLGITSQQNCSLLAVKITEFTTPFEIKIFPNPFDISTTLQTNISLSNATLSVYNVYGQLVSEQYKINGNVAVLHRKSLANGIYFFRLSEGNKIIATKRVIIANK